MTARERFAAGRVAVLATVDGTGRPHLVPVTFAVEGGTVWSAVDGKPKRGKGLRRLANIEADPAVSLLVQYWDEDWTRLWWVRADGTARITAEPSTVEHVAALLRGKYEQYARVDVPGPVIAVTVDTWREWTAG